MITYNPANIWKTGKTILKGDDVVDAGKISGIKYPSGQPRLDIIETMKSFNKPVTKGDTKPIIKEYDISPKKKHFIDFFSQE